MGGQDRHDQRAIQKVRGCRDVDALPGEALHSGRHILAGIVESALSVLGEIRQHREQHEGPDECQRVIETERVQTPIHGVRRLGYAPIAVDRACPDALNALEQLDAPVGTDDVAQKLAHVPDVGVLGDGFGGAHWGSLLQRRLRRLGTSASLPAPLVRLSGRRFCRLCFCLACKILAGLVSSAAFRGYARYDPPQSLTRTRGGTRCFDSRERCWPARRLR